jgi:GNAT superfamily N-acetyltransferase
MPDAYLDGLDAAQREGMWAQHLKALPVRHAVLVAELDDLVPTVAGFAALGPEGNVPTAGRAELYALNVDPRHWGRGIGTRLLGAALQELQRLGYPDAILWVASRNVRAHRLYERSGWTRGGVARVEDVLGVSVEEVQFARSLAPG